MQNIVALEKKDVQDSCSPFTIILLPPYHNLISPNLNSVVYKIEIIASSFLSWAIVRTGESSLTVWKITNLVLPEQKDYFY